MLLVNRIDEQKNMRTGYCVKDEMILRHNFPEMFGFEKANTLINRLVDGKQNSYLIERYCQFVVYIQYDVETGLRMTIYEFLTFDGLLDEYSILKENNWLKKDIDNISKLFSEIKNQEASVDQMVLQDPV